MKSNMAKKSFLSLARERSVRKLLTLVFSTALMLSLSLLLSSRSLALATAFQESQKKAAKQQRKSIQPKRDKMVAGTAKPAPKARPGNRRKR